MVKDYYNMLLYLIWMEASLKSIKSVYTVSYVIVIHQDSHAIVSVCKAMHS